MKKLIFGILFLCSINLYADLASGFDKYNKGNYKEAVEIWIQACSEGDRDACHNAGFMFYAGDKIKQDCTKALKFFSDACNGGRNSSCNNAGNMYSRAIGIKQDFTKAKEYFTKACDYDNLDACNKLGNLYNKEERYIKSKELFTKSCDGGFADGGFSLGLLHLKGYGVKQNKTKAEKLFYKACKDGSTAACKYAAEVQ